MKKIITLIFMSVLSFNANAASVDLYDDAAGFEYSTSFIMEFDTAKRSTYLEVLNPVSVSALGAEINPSSSSEQFLWEVFESDEFKTLGTNYYSLGVSFTDVGMGIYDTATSGLMLSEGYYILSLKGDGAEMPSNADYNHTPFPFTTSDGNFLVIDAAAGLGELPSSLAWGNVLVPSFSISASVVPIPAAVYLFASGLGLLGWMRRKVS